MTNRKLRFNTLESLSERRLAIHTNPILENGYHQKLTARERTVLELVCDGLTNKEIGRKLGIVETTVRGHVQLIIQKLQVRNRTACAAEAIRRHLVD